MGDKENGSTPATTYILFPVKQKDETICYYTSDYSEELGNSVYKGYLCTLKTDKEELKPRRIKKEEINIDESKPVAIKIYQKNQHPSPYQFYTSQIAVLEINGHDALIMDFIDGFHIFPDIEDNPKIKLLTFAQAADIAWQLILGLNHYHYRNTSGHSIVHGDVKGTNVKIRVKETEVDGLKKYKIDTFYLDPDYAKPIVGRAQDSQGTPEHLALEVLDGWYSEESDFFALSPLLFSLFGAHNPLSKILEYRNNHQDMTCAELVKQLRTIDFCSTGLFEHFTPKPAPIICRLVEQFIFQMGAKLKSNRPSPDALLEFFTALRQFSLLHELKQDTGAYLLRLCIVAQDECWLRDKKFLTLFITLDKNLQSRLIAVMNPHQSISLYKILQENRANPGLLNQLRKKVATQLAEEGETLKAPSRLSALFSSPVTSKDIQWLLNCYEHNNHTEFYSAQNKKMREKLTHCDNKKIANFISIITDGLCISLELSTPSI